MQNFDYLKNILNSFLSEDDIYKLDVNNSHDEQSRLFKSYIIQLFDKGQNYQDSLSILNSQINNPNLQLFERLFGIDNKKIFKSIQSKSKDNIWDLFCPEALEASRDPDGLSSQLLKKRKLYNIQESKKVLTSPYKEILFTSNVLITTPSDFSSPNIPEEINQELQEFKNTNQNGRKKARR